MRRPAPRRRRSTRAAGDRRACRASRGRRGCDARLAPLRRDPSAGRRAVAALARGRASRRAAYYRMPLHRQPAMAPFADIGPGLPVTEELAATQSGAADESDADSDAQAAEVARAIAAFGGRAAGCGRVRVWVDLTNSPHVLVMAPIIDRLRARGSRGRRHRARFRPDARAVRPPRHRPLHDRRPPRLVAERKGARARRPLRRADALRRARVASISPSATAPTM